MSAKSTVLSPRTKWMPGWLYQALPYVYSLSGLVAIYFFEAPPGYSAGILLLFAACLVWMMRNKNKN